MEEPEDCADITGVVVGATLQPVARASVYSHTARCQILTSVGPEIGGGSEGYIVSAPLWLPC